MKELHPYSRVSAPTAAYVAEALGLPTNPYESVNILTGVHTTTVPALESVKLTSHCCLR